MSTAQLPLAEFITRSARRRGPAFTMGAGPIRTSYLIGPEANAFVFGHDRLFRVREAFRALIPVDGETALIVTDGPDHARRRALVRPGLHQRQINDYVRIMAHTADEALETVASRAASQPWDAYELFRAAIRRSTMRSLFGDRFAGRADGLGEDLQPLLDLVNLWPQLVALHERVGTPRWRRSREARARVDEVVYAEIARARSQGPDAESNVLSTLVHGRDEQGSGLSDLEVRDQVVSLIAAGYETTSGAMAWWVHSVGRDQGLQERLRSELHTAVGRGVPEASHLRELPLLAATVSETLRLFPPAALSARHVAEEFEFAGHRVPAGATLVYSPYVTHRDPAVYADPLTFRPERWLAQPKRPPQEFLPFGGGAHRCIGSAMATTELTVMAARLLARGPFTVSSERLRATSFAAMRPRNGVPVNWA